MTGVELGRMTSGEVIASTLLVPLGATEQHGHHLPLDTDTTIALAWCRALAERHADVTVAPAMPYGSSGEHQDFPGTLSIGAEAIALFVVEITRSARATFDRVVFVCGHAGNAEPVGAAVSKLRYEGHNVELLLPIVEGSDAHAGRTETSLMLHVDPAAVRSDKAEVGCLSPMAEIINELRTGGVIAVSANGILGDATTASEVEGQQALEMLMSRWVPNDTAC